MIFLILSNEMCEHLGNLHNSVNGYFPNDQCMMVQHYAWVKDPFQVQDSPLDLNILTENKEFTE